MRAKPVPNDHPAGWHWSKFAEWTVSKDLVGEPSPHMKLAAELSKHESWEERAWRAGCYAAPYSVLSGEILWTFWPWERITAEPGQLLPWLNTHFTHLHIRTERRCVRTAEKMDRCLRSYADWARYDLPEVAGSAGRFDPQTYYNVVWQNLERVEFLGRYIMIRLIELLRRSCGISAELYDIRAIGGWSPIRMLTLLYPEHEDALLGGDGALAMTLGERAIDRLRAEPDLADVTPYRVAAMLCEYRKAYENRDEYPGRTLDQELASFEKYMPYWEQQGFKSGLMAARAALFPDGALGERHGWSGLRKPLGGVLRDHGYVWSDMRYEYDPANLAHPTRRS